MQSAKEAKSEEQNYENSCDRSRGNRLESGSRFVRLRERCYDPREGRMGGYIDMLFRLVLSGKDKETTCRCLEAIAYVYETGMIGLMKKEK